jgi:hypothetical protein
VSGAGLDQLENLRTESAGTTLAVEGGEDQACRSGQFTPGGRVLGLSVEYLGLIEQVLTVGIGGRSAAVERGGGRLRSVKLSVLQCKKSHGIKCNPDSVERLRRERGYWLRNLDGTPS